MMNKLSLLVSSLLTVLFIACAPAKDAAPSSPTSGGEGKSSDVTQPLQGKIAGKSFSAISGRAVPSYFPEDSRVSVEIWNVDNVTDVCAPMLATVGQMILMATPATTGRYPLSNTLNVTLVDLSENKNRIATNGEIIIESVTDQEITGSIQADFNSDNAVSGRFNVKRCQSQTP